MRGSRFAVLCAVTGLLLLAVIVARGTTAVPNAPRDLESEWEAPPRTASGAAVDDAPPPPDMREFTDVPGQIRDGSLIFTFVLILAAVLFLVLRALSLWRRRRPRKVWVGIHADEEDEESGNAMPARLRRAAEQARTELAARTGGPPDDAVIAAWLLLEEAAEGEGAGREPHQTPTEFTVALLGRYTTDVPALDELRGLYQRARFGRPGDVAEADVERARAALDRILHALGETAKP